MNVNHHFYRVNPDVHHKYNRQEDSIVYGLILLVSSPSTPLLSLISTGQTKIPLLVTIRGGALGVVYIKVIKTLLGNSFALVVRSD